MSDNNNKSVLVLDLKIDSPKALLCSLSTSALTTRMFVVRMSDSWISHSIRLQCTAYLIQEFRHNQGLTETAGARNCKINSKSLRH